MDTVNTRFIKVKKNLQKIKLNYEHNVENFLHIFIVFIFAISILLVINSTYNLILILIDGDKSIYEGDYKKYKSIRDLLGYKILMNSYKSGYTSTTEYYNDTYLTLNTNAFLLNLTVYITVSGIIIFALFTFLTYMLPNSNIKEGLTNIINDNLPLIITCFALLVLLIVFYTTNKATIKGYKADRLDAKDTAENNFIYNYLIKYNGINVHPSVKDKTPVKISYIKEAIKDTKKDELFSTILNKLKYLDKYNISQEITEPEKIKIESLIETVKNTTDASVINKSIREATLPAVPAVPAKTEDIDKAILLYCYYFTRVNKDNDVDPVKLIYEFIKKVKQIILDKDINKNNDNFFDDIHRNLMGLGEEIEFVYNKIIPNFLVSSYVAKDDNKKLLDDKYENLFIESLYTCDYIGDKKIAVENIKENIDKAKDEKKNILISIVVTFVIALLLILIYLQKDDIKTFYYWTYIDNIKKDAGKLGFLNYLNLSKFFEILKK